MDLRKKTPKVLSLDPRSRRMFLKSAGGLALAMPLLPSLLTASSEKALALSAKPLRYVNFMTGMGGLAHRNWFGTTLPTTPYNLYSGHTARIDPIAGLLRGGQLSPVLNTNYANLFPYMNVIAGADQPFYYGHNRSVGNGVFARRVDGHTWPSDQLDFGSPNLLSIEYPSLDQIIGNAGGNGIYLDGLAGRRRFANLAMYGNNGSFGKDDYSSPTDAVMSRDIQNSSAGLFSSLFGNGIIQAQTGSTPILALINEFWPSGKALMNRLTATDRDSLDQLFQIAQQASNDYANAPILAGNIAQPTGTGMGWSDDPRSFNAVADIIALAFRSDVTRVITLSSDYPCKGHDWHALSHRAGTVDVTNEAVNGQPELTEIHKYLSDSLVARLGNNLLAQDPFDPSNTILHNSLIKWVMEHKIAHHNNSNPLMMMGRAGGRLETGLFADLRNFSRPLSVDGMGDQLYVGDIINRDFATTLYAMNIARSNYEVTRGGDNATTDRLTTGWGYTFKVPGNAWNSTPIYELTKIGEPWEFLRKAGMPWA